MRHLFVISHPIFVPKNTLPVLTSSETHGFINEEHCTSLNKQKMNNDLRKKREKNVFERFQTNWKEFSGY